MFADWCDEQTPRDDDSRRGGAGEAAGALDGPVVLRVSPWKGDGIQVTFALGWGSVLASTATASTPSFTSYGGAGQPLQQHGAGSSSRPISSSSSSLIAKATHDVDIAVQFPGRGRHVVKATSAVVVPAPQSSGLTAVVLALSSNATVRSDQFAAATSVLSALPPEELVSIWILALPEAILVSDVTSDRRHLDIRLRQARAIFTSSTSSPTTRMMNSTSAGRGGSGGGGRAGGDRGHAVRRCRLTRSG